MRVVRYRPRLYNVQGGQLEYRDRLRHLMLDLSRQRVGLLKSDMYGNLRWLIRRNKVDVLFPYTHFFGVWGGESRLSLMNLPP